VGKPEKYGLFFLLCLISVIARTQPQGDTLATDSMLTYPAFMQLVQDNHPVARMARLETDLARQYVRAARGGFDPVIGGEMRDKRYRETDYYDARRIELDIPTWMGVSLNAGLEQNDGVYLNPESTVPEGGLVNAGITAELGAGLLMDSRRAALRQAQIGLDMGRQEQQLMLNKLFVEATKVYYQWALAEQTLALAEEAVELANFRYNGVRESYKLGDLPAIDTVEAYTQVLNRLYFLRGQQTQWVEAVNRVGAFLWDEDGNALPVSPGVSPSWREVSEALPEELQGLQIDLSHPKLQQLDGKRSIADIDRRLAAEYLRPKVSLKYNFLTEDVMAAPVDDFFTESRFFENNYQFGAKVSFPIFLREARGKLGVANVKIDRVEQEYQNTRASLEADLRTAWTTRANLQDQIRFYRQNVELQQQLLDGERALFNNGESSLFLINARETAVIKSRQMLLELQVKASILEAKIREIAGRGF